jgi:hypothetical protein
MDFDKFGASLPIYQRHWYYDCRIKARNAPDKTGENSAVVEYRIKVQQNPLFPLIQQQYQVDFSRRALFNLYDDGWRLVQ